MTDTRKALWAFFVLVTVGINAGAYLALWWSAWIDRPISPPLGLTTLLLLANFAIAAWMLSPGKEGT